MCGKMITFPDKPGKQYPIRSTCKEGCSKNGAIKISQVAATEMGVAATGTHDLRWEFNADATARASPAPQPPAPVAPQSLEQHGTTIAISDFAGPGACNQPIDFSKEPAVAIVRTIFPYCLITNYRRSMDSSRSCAAR
jgi:hypothetical protein